MKRIIIGTLSLLLLVISGCNKEDIFTDQNNFGSHVEQNGSIYKSTFLIDKDIVTFNEEIDNLIAHLTSHSSAEVTSDIEASIEHLEDAHRLTLYVPKELKNGDYTLRLECDVESKARANEITPEDIEEYSFLVTIEDMMVSNVMLSSVASKALYEMMGLDGSGTEKDPFIIGSSEKFGMFKSALNQDETKGAGLFFKQTATFDAPRKSDLYEDSYSSCFNFAGTYDGGNYSILLVQYKGTDKNIGLFATLLDGANIHDLNINPRYEDSGDNCGGVAGRCLGKVTLKNIFVYGHITSTNSNMGGLIGEASSSDLTIENCQIGVSVVGKDNVGGVVGFVEGSSSSITIDGVVNMDMKQNLLMTSVNGVGSNVGGIIGRLENSKFSIKNVTLENSISEESALGDDSPKFIYAQEGYAGGVIGNVYNCQSGSELINISMLTPVSSKKDIVGGIVGRAYYSSINVDNAIYASYVNGENSVGGFFGELTNTMINLGANNRIEMVPNAYLKVEGTNEVGGFCGKFYNGNIVFTEDFHINVNVDGAENVGGCIGSLSSKWADFSGLNCSNHMSVSGVDAVGGIVGLFYGGGEILGKSPSVKVAINNNNQIPTKDPFVENSSFSGTVKAIGGSAGGIVGCVSMLNSNSECTLNYLTFTGTVRGSVAAGGVVGYTDSYINVNNCVNYSSMLDSSQDSAYVGGIIGEINMLGVPEITYCINYANIKSGGSAVAGIIGVIKAQNDTSKFENLINVGDIEGSGSVAGVIGLIQNVTGVNPLTIFESANYGSIESKSGEYVGGVLACGRNKRTLKIYSCANHGDIHGVQCNYAGGIAGNIGATDGVYAHDDVDVRSCCNRGAISSDKYDSTYIAGILGSQGDGDLNSADWGTFDCYNTGAITSDHNDDVGGIVGYAEDEAFVQRCINIGHVSYGNGVVGHRRLGSDVHFDHLYYLEGSGKEWKSKAFKESDKKNKGTFEGFDFNNVWAIDSDDTMNDGYPYLRNCKYQSMALSE